MNREIDVLRIALEAAFGSAINTSDEDRLGSVLYSIDQQGYTLVPQRSLRRLPAIQSIEQREEV